MKQFLQTPTQTEICVHHVPQANAKAVVLLLHGYFSHAQTRNNHKAAMYFKSLGFHVACPDFYGRGESSGVFGDLTVARGIETAQCCLDAIKRDHPNVPIMITGGSFGGLVAMHLAHDRSNAIECLILRAPVSDWRALWQREVPREKMMDWVRDGSFSDVMPNGRTVTFGMDLYREMIGCNAVYDTFSSAIHVPTLIVHGDADEMVPLAQAQKLHQSMPHSELVILGGADHAFSRDTDVVRYQDAIKAFLNKQKRL